jgi:hypothetical protein
LFEEFVGLTKLLRGVFSEFFLLIFTCFYSLTELRLSNLSRGVKDCSTLVLLALLHIRHLLLLYVLLLGVYRVAWALVFEVNKLILDA